MGVLNEKRCKDKNNSDKDKNNGDKDKNKK